MPSWLDAEGRAEWRRLVAKYLALGVLYGSDGSILAHMCEAHSLAVGATKDARRKRLVAAYGQKVKNPMIRVAQEARAQMLSFAKVFNLRIAERLKEEGLDSAAEKLKEAERRDAMRKDGNADQAEAFLFRPQLVKPG